ncbi:MAG: glycosyltransferase family 39 protein [Chloroflexi bacterium]|nr:glycosyltransferase family 39 protein [Chloroflexota bacterium]
MSVEPQPPISPEPPQHEPTVLDLYKSVTKDWSSFLTFVTSLGSPERLADVERVAAEDARLQETAPAPAEVRLEVGSLPWRMLGAVLLALYAQSQLEPPDPNVELAVSLYVFAILLALWSYFKDEWQLPSLRPDLAQADPMTLRIIPLLISVGLMVSAFASFNENLFTVMNVTLWLLTIATFLWAVWVKTPRIERTPPAPEARRKAVLWAVLVVAVMGMALFFRLYRVDSVPSEPFSDHAEKILDVYEITTGSPLIFFPRNTGREAFQMYWTLLVATVFNTGFSFLSLKLGTTLLGVLTLPFIYLLGREWGGARVGLFALFLFGVAYWPNVIARIGLRFPLYPLFVAPTLFFLMRGLRTRNRNDFLLAGLFLGLGLHGYSPFRMMPLVVVAAFALYLLHPQSKDARGQAIWWLTLIVVLSAIVFMPLGRYWMDNPDSFSYRAFSRLGDVETQLSGPAWQIFFSNLWNGLRMFNLDDGEIWVNSIPHRPALDVVTGALFIFGALFVLIRYLRRRDWRDLFLLVSVPLLMMPSVLSLAFPDENPALNRSGAAAIPAILLAALALDGLVKAFGSGRRRTVVAWGLAGLLLAASAYQNYNLVFNVFDAQFKAGAWNTSEMGMVISDFRAQYGETDTLWIVPFPYWVDTRLPGVWAGIPDRDFALFKENLSSSLEAPYPKLFIYWPQDGETEAILRDLYPQGSIRRYSSAVDPSKDFMIYFVEK